MKSKQQKVGLILQARTGSSRLPGKVLKGLLGKPMLSRVIERLKRCQKIDEIIMATTNLPQDRVLVELAEAEDVRGFAGNCLENDVLTRYLQAAQHFNIDVIARVTADCPLIDPQVVDSFIDKFFELGVDYLTNSLTKTFPHGVDAEVFYTSCLAESSELSDKIEEREHVVIPMRHHPERFKIINIEAEGVLRRPEIRITVDTIADFFVVEKIYQALYPQKGNTFNTLDVITFLDKNPEVKNFNLV